MFITFFNIKYRFIYVGCGADINCFSVSSGKLVASYTADQNFGRIVSLCFHPSNDKLLVAIHLNAVIVFWNLIGTQAAKLSKQQVIQFKLSIYNFNKYLLSCVLFFFFNRN